MISRFRMVAGPNGSGKSTLAAWLAYDSYSEDAGLDILVPEADLPQWFKNSEIVKKEQR